MAELILSLRDRELSRRPILHTEVTIGRGLEADLVIDNAGVSRTHARIRFDGQRFIATDAGSQNGITVNGNAVHEQVLADGDVIGIHKFAVHFRMSGGVPIDQLQPRRASRRAPRDVMRTVQIQTHGTGNLPGTPRAPLAHQAAGSGLGWWLGAACGLGVGALATALYFLLLH